MASRAAGRLGRAEEMAGPAAFLASDAASFMTGQGARHRRQPDGRRLNRRPPRRDMAPLARRTHAARPLTKAGRTRCRNEPRSGARRSYTVHRSLGRPGRLPAPLAAPFGERRRTQRRTRSAGRRAPRRRGRSRRWRAGTGRRPRPAPSAGIWMPSWPPRAGGPGRGRWRRSPSGGSARRPRAARRPGAARPRPSSPTQLVGLRLGLGDDLVSVLLRRSIPAAARAGRRRDGSGRPARTPWRRAARRVNASCSASEASFCVAASAAARRSASWRSASSRQVASSISNSASACARCGLALLRGSAAPATASRRPAAWRW